MCYSWGIFVTFTSLFSLDGAFAYLLSLVTPYGHYRSIIHPHSQVTQQSLRTHCRAQCTVLAAGVTSVQGTGHSTRHSSETWNSGELECMSGGVKFAQRHSVCHWARASGGRSAWRCFRHRVLRSFWEWNKRLGVHCTLHIWMEKAGLKQSKLWCINWRNASLWQWTAYNRQQASD